MKGAAAASRGAGRGPRGPWALGAGEGRPGMRGEDREARGGAGRRWAAEGGASRGRVGRREERARVATGRWGMRRLAGKKERESMERRGGQGLQKADAPFGAVDRALHIPGLRWAAPSPGTLAARPALAGGAPRPPQPRKPPGPESGFGLLSEPVGVSWG